MEEREKNKECEKCLNEGTMLEDGLVGVKWIDNPQMSMKGWKPETFCNKRRKEFEFAPGVVKSLTSLMKGYFQYNICYFQSCCFSVSLSFWGLGIFCCFF